MAYRRRLLHVYARWTALADIYKPRILLHRSDFYCSVPIVVPFSHVKHDSIFLDFLRCLLPFFLRTFVAILSELRVYFRVQPYFFVSIALFPWVSGHMLVKPSGPPDSISLFSRLFRERLSSGSARSCLRLHLTSLTGIPVWTFSRFLVEQSFRQVECFSLPWSAARGSPG